MKKVIILILFVLISCGTSKKVQDLTARYNSNITSYEYVRDSIKTADGILFPDLSEFIKSEFKSQIGIETTYLYYIKSDRTYILSLTDLYNGKYQYKYRVE